MIEHDNLTPEELQSYRSLLNEAYPASKTDIHERVMKQIRAERMAQKKRAQRAAFVKWGSVAAVVAIACLVGFKAIPEAGMFVPMTNNDAAEAYDLAPRDADGAYKGYSAEADEVSGYAVSENAPGCYTVDDDSVITNSGAPTDNAGEKTEPSYGITSAPEGAAETEVPAETEETEAMAEAEETVPVSE